jgi:predicted unusual protein kinase regulating ubiquinone biosynthesis (AarF/ABC1/UbiB family)
MVSSIQETAKRTLQETGETLAIPRSDSCLVPGRYTARISDILRSNYFLWVEAGLQIGEHLNRANPFGLTFSRTLVLGTVAADLISAYLTLQNRARWLPWLVKSQDWEQQHVRGAKRLLDTATSLGGALIKGGQFASTRPDLLPPVYIEYLSRLQDKVVPLGWAEIEKAIKCELGRPLEEIFSAIEPTPIAAASLSQVHRAWLKNGQMIALKVQYPHVKELVAADLEVLNRSADLIALVAPKVKLHSIVQFLKDTFLLELDLQREAEAMTELRRALAHRDDVVIPLVFPQFSTKRLLAMEYIEGIKVTDVAALEAANINPSDVVRAINEVYAEQVFQHHFLHADPHPGNILVQPGPRLVLLDHGLTVKLSENLAQAMGDMVKALVVGDFEAVAQALISAGLKIPPGLEVMTLLQVVGVIFGGRGKEHLGEIGSELGAIIGHIPTDLLMVGRALGMLNGISVQLDAEQQTLKTVAAYV